jgi:hypothetical protein
MPDDAWEVAAGVVRPYLFTQGRTRPTNRLLAVEAMLASTAKGDAIAPGLAPEQRRILELCHDPQSVAEVAARLATPLGVVRVLVADLADEALLEVLDADTSDLAADVNLLQRLIARVKAIPV